MATQSSALVRRGLRAERTPHIAEWTAQLVLGVRAMRRLVVTSSSPAFADEARMTSGAAEPSRAHPAFDADENGRTSSPP
jgi:hypothetical protein